MKVGANAKMGNVDGGDRHNKDENHEVSDIIAYDDVSGESLDPKQVLKARTK